MKMPNPKSSLLLAAVLVLSAGLSAGCVTHYHDHDGYGVRRDPYYGDGYGYRHPRPYPRSYGYPGPHPGHPHRDRHGSLEREQDRERHALKRDPQDDREDLRREDQREREDERWD